MWSSVQLGVCRIVLLPGLLCCGVVRFVSYFVSCLVPFVASCSVPCSAGCLVSCVTTCICTLAVACLVMCVVHICGHCIVVLWSLVIVGQIVAWTASIPFEIFG